jgi:outer membrane protein assembly factor BamB
VSETLSLDWEYQPQWTLKGVKKSANNQAIMSGRVNGRPMIFVRQPGGNYVQTTLDDKDIPALGFSELASQWQTAGWRPASSPVIQDGRVYLKSEARTICVDAGSGTVRWMGRPTRFPIDDWSRQLAQVAAHGVNVSYPSASLIAGRQPKTLTEIMLFSDRLHHGLAVEGGRVFAVEGELDTPSARKQTTDAALERRAPGAQLPSQSSRHNELACYDALTGRMIWTATRGAGLPERASLWSGPLVVGSQVLVAIGIDTQLEIAALDVATGQTIWKTSLAELGRAAPTIPVGLTVDDGSLYVASGAGTLFSLDRNGGALRWAASYPRLKTSASERRAIEMNAAPRVQIVLDENFVARDGDLVVLAASDSDHIMAFDVTDGSLRWDSPLPPAAMGSSLAYVIGLADGRMQLANDKCLWSVNTGGGRIVWDLPLEGSYGRGLLADGRLFVPQRRTILELDPATGRAIGKADVATPDSEPVGNLIAAGDHLLVASAARLLSVKPEKAPGIDPMQDSNTSPPGVKP